MTPLTNFFLSFIFSFIGSIPPGTLNLTVIQLGLDNRMAAALRFAFAASMVEYPYAWIAVKFERLITSSPVVTENLHLIAAIVMIVFGVISLWQASKPTSDAQPGFRKSGFRKGFLLGILNPLALPYWIAITAYLKSQGWIDLSAVPAMHAYFLGVFAGAFLLLLLSAYLAQKVMSALKNFPAIRKVPGFTLVALGIFSFVQYILRTAV